jgi:putative FmdB family regulatory protein
VERDGLLGKHVREILKEHTHTLVVLCASQRNKTVKQMGGRILMPIFEFLCADCGKTSEMLVSSTSDIPKCHNCESLKLTKLLSAPSSLSGGSRRGIPGPADTGCCGNAVGHSGCAGPGSCCGKTPF